MQRASARRRLLPIMVSIAIATPSLWAPTSPAQATQPPPAPDFTTQLRHQLADPNRDHRPGVFWWWPGASVTASELDADIKALKTAGFGSAQVTDLEPGPIGNGSTTWQWGTKKWFDALTSAMTSATSRGVRLDIPPYPVWPMSSPTATLTNDQAAQAAYVAHKTLNGPATYHGSVPRPLTQAGYQTFQAVGAARVVGHKSGTTQLDPTSAIDLTDKVTRGTLTWAVPKGTWALYGVWRRPTGQTPQTVPGGAVLSLDPILGSLIPGNLLAIDPFSQKATAAALTWLDQHINGGTLKALLKKNGGQLYEDSFEYAANPADSVLLGLAKEFVENGFQLPRSTLDLLPNQALGVLWSADFLQAFRKYRGYDLRPYLPAIFNGTLGFDFTGGIGTRVRNDYQKTLTDLVIVHQRQLRAWAKRNGFSDLRHQTYGIPINSGYANGKVGGISDTESLEAGDPQPPGSPQGEAALDMYRIAAGAAHIYGSKEVNIEAGDVFGLPNCSHLADQQHKRFCLYGEQPSDYWQIFNHGFAGGATHIQMHGLSYLIQPSGLNGAGWLGPQTHPWPGWSTMWYFFSESWNRTWPQWNFWREFNTYLGRASMILTAGKPRIDVAYYRDDVLGFGIPVLPADGRQQKLVRAGYTYEFLDPQTLVDRASMRDGRLFADGPGYRALVIDSANIASGGVPADAAQKLVRLGQAGLPIVIVGANSLVGTSAKSPITEDRQVKAAFASLARLPNVTRVATSADVGTGLQRLHVAPDLSFGKSALLRPIHRSTPQADYWYLWNEGQSTVQIDARLRTTGTPYQGDLWNNTFTPIKTYSTVGKTLRIPLTLTPGAATVLVAEHGKQGGLHAVSSNAEAVVASPVGLQVEDHRGGTFTVRLSNGSGRQVRLAPPGKPYALNRWHLSVREFTPGKPTTHELDLNGLKDWRDIPSLRTVSGTGTYTTSFALPATWLSKKRGVELDLGEVAGAVRIWLNGKRVTQETVILPGARFRLDQLLRPGTNRLKITLATPPRNAMVGQAQAGDPRYAYFLISPAQANGLIGPARLVPLSRAPVSSGRLLAH